MSIPTRKIPHAMEAAPAEVTKRTNSRVPAAAIVTKHTKAAAAELRRTGRDVFALLDKNIACFCRNGSYEEAGKHIETATPAECSEALAQLVRHGKYRPEVNLALAEKLFARGGRIDPGLVQKYAVLKPDQLRNPVTYTAKMRQLIRKYQNR